ncbi:MAG: hypothetical protein RLZZ366_189 [Pseudomonadota bacterium]|jgi:hypothetical protein
MKITGSCLCGAVTLSCNAAPIRARTCWCRLCQYLAAGNATVNLVFPAESVALTGDVTWYDSVAESGNHMSRGFCGKCGTPVFSKSAEFAQFLIIRAGALDDLKSLPPQATIWTSEAPAWAHIDPDLPHFPQQPPPVT